MEQEEIDALVDDVREAMLFTFDHYGWIKGRWGNETDGYCMLGALNKVTGDGESYGFILPIFQYCMEETVDNLFPGRSHDIPGFNDAPFTSQEDVSLLVKHSFERMKEVLPQVIEHPDLAQRPSAIAAKMIQVQQSGEDLSSDSGSPSGEAAG